MREKIERFWIRATQREMCFSEQVVRLESDYTELEEKLKIVEEALKQIEKALITSSIKDDETIDIIAIKDTALKQIKGEK